MTPAEYKRMSSIERLRHAVRCFGDVRESFLALYNTEELLRLHWAWMMSGWDISPDKWQEDQVAGAIVSSKIPKFDENERPIL